ASPTPTRERLLADFGWKFHLGHADDPAKDFNFGRAGGDGMFGKAGDFLPGGRRGLPGITQPGFDTTSWQPVDLPHDWAVDLPFVDDRAVNGHGAKPLGRTYPDTSIGWYRREFTIDPRALGRRFALEFDGIFRDAIVVLNGHFIGRNLSGYAPARYDVTDFLTYVTRDPAGPPNPDHPGRNVLLVRVDATEAEGWFYEGAGIYRHVWLESTSPVHVAPNGTFVTAEVRGETAVLTIQTEVVNDSDKATAVTVTSDIESGDGKRAGGTTSASTPIPAWSRQTVTERVSVAQPNLWSLDHPSLYRLRTTVRAAAGTPGPLDQHDTPFGIRTVRFDANTGLFINGQPVKIKGTCNHQDHAGVGSGLPDRLQEFRIARLKEMGSNAYRTSHNPPTPELLDACDRLGMLVLDETRMMSSNDEGLGELERLIRRDRNHPSVFCWSIGNEEPEQGTDRGARVAETMKRLARDLDPTRLVTEAMNSNWGRGLSAVVDVQGFNYGKAEAMDAYHAAHPTQPTMGTEVASTVSTRGIYENDPVKGYVSAYDINHPPWAATAEDWWTTYDARPWVAGGFVWTGFDYRGEPTTNNASQGWPCISSHFGIMDTCGFPKDLFYYYRAWWTNEPTLHLFPHWNWAGKEGQDIDVWVFSNVDSVELVVNGASLGTQKVQKDAHLAWKVPYAPGTLEARGTKAGHPPMVVRRDTTGEAASIQLVPDRPRVSATGEDVSVVEARIIDANGRVVPTAGHEVTFTISGEGRLIGVGNGDPSSHEADRVPPGAETAWKRRAFNGLCMALVQATRQPGEVHVEASSPGLTPTTVAITTAAATPRPSLV
ncbi:MAG TPA: beta-galactosidase GalA, partial [Vicinamibacterales bacterium]